MSKHIIPVLCIILVAAAKEVYTESKGENGSSLQTNNGEQEHPISIAEVMATLQSVQKEMTAKLNMLQKNMASQMQTLEKIQNDIAEQKVNVTNNVIQYSNLVYYNSTHMAKKYYSEYEIAFVGFGHRINRDDCTTKRDISFENCLQYCKQVRDDQGDEWNGLYYFWPHRYCSCEKNETGHWVDKSYFHYKFH